MTISCVFIFLVGRKLFNTKVGLLATLIVPLTSNFIQIATAIIPMSLGFSFFVMILYLIIYFERKTASYYFLIILLSISLILTHTIATFVTLCSFLSIYIGVKMFKRVGRLSTWHDPVPIILMLLFGLATLIIWMQEPIESTSFFSIALSQLLSSLQTNVQFTLTAPSSATNVPFITQLLNAGGYSLLTIFAVIGALINLQPNNRTESRMALVSVAAILFVLPYSFIIFGLENILPSRWTLFLYVPLIILAVQGLLGMCTLLKYNFMKLGMITSVLLAIIFAMLTSDTVNNESPWIYNGAIRSGYTQSELTAAKTLSDMKCGRYRADLYYGLTVPYIIGYDAYMDMGKGSSTWIFVERNYYLHHPKWNEKYKARIFHEKDESQYVIISEYMKNQGLDSWPLIYSNGNVKAYATPK